MRKIGQSMAAAMVVMRAQASAMFGSNTPHALPVGGYRSKSKYNFRSTLKKLSATRRYASIKFRKMISGNAVSPYKSGRGALGARKRACGVHWVQKLA